MGFDEWQEVSRRGYKKGSKDDDVTRISTSVFVTNFPTSFTAKELYLTCSETPTKVVVDNRDVLGLIDSGGAHNFAQPNAGTGSEVVAGLSKEFQERDMVDALSRVVEQKS
ncbi:hypothetical protein Tco_0746828 [Tanacetum coccineum]